MRLSQRFFKYRWRYKSIRDLLCRVRKRTGQKRNWKYSECPVRFPEERQDAEHTGFALPGKETDRAEAELE